MADIDKILQAAEQQIAQLAVTQLAKFKDQAVADAHDFVQSIKDDLADWTSALQAGQMDKDEFINLVQGEESLAEMNALKEQGLTDVAIDAFTNGVTQILINSAFAVVGL